jgi:hypothetical protein
MSRKRGQDKVATGESRRDLDASARAKLAAIRHAARHRYPAPDIETVLREIERGYEPPHSIQQDPVE